MHVTAVSKQQRDFDVFSTVLAQKEGVIDLHVSRDSIELYLRKLKTELNSEKSLLEQYKLYSATIEKLHGGHTQIMPTRKVQAEWLAERNSLPFDIHLIGRRLVVGDLELEDLEAFEEEFYDFDEIVLPEEGSEILSIDNRTVDQMMSHMGKYISSDEGTMDFKYYQASQMFDFYRHLAIPYTQDSVLVEYVTPNKDTLESYFNTGVAPVYSINDRLSEISSEYYSSEDDHGKFKIVRNDFGYFRFKSFTSSMGREYEYFLKQAFTKLNDQHIDKLIVDLRGNTGGVMQYSFMKYMVGEGVNLGKYVIEKPNDRYNRKHVSKVNIHYLRHTLMSMQQRRRKESGLFNEGIQETESVDTSLIYNGQVIVITDEGTFSSAAMLACHLKTMKKAKIVGRTAGGSFYAGNAGTLLARLPQSGFLLAINPNTFYSHLERDDDPREIKEPDLYLDPFIIDKKEQDQYYFKQAVTLFN